MSRARRGRVYRDLMKLTTSLVIALGLALTACDGGSSTDDCINLCTEAQAGDCTSVTGNCGSFCTALDAVQGPANCVSQRDTYESCLESGVNVCDTNCDAAETALEGCIIDYCEANQSDSDCVTLALSF